MRPPAAPGQRLEEVDTPALILDLDAFEANLRTLADAVRGTGVRVRTHAKTHKCPEVARRQMALGAVGACCQKVSEAEAMVAGGIGDVLVTNEIVGAPKVERLARLGDIHPGEKPGQFIAPHGMGVDSQGNLYVGEVSYTVWGRSLTPPQTFRCFRKLRKLA